MLTSLKRLLTAIVDYAGLFPPAQISLPEAINVYDCARAASHCWMLDRFVLPATQLQEFVKLLPSLSESVSLPQPWSLSVILSKNWRAEFEQIQQMTETGQCNKSLMRISALEVAPLSPIEVQKASLALPANVDTFFEISFEADLEPYVNILQQIKAGAKLRTGGITHDAFPSSTQLSQHILALAKAQIPFKATAGLHHALRGHCFSHASNVTTMHGFLNVAIASALAYQQTITLNEAVAILEEPLIGSFHFSDTAIGWHDHRLPIAAIEQSRQHFFRSFGSCSFQEPIHDLYDLKLL